MPLRRLEKYRIYKNHYIDDANFYVYKFDYEILKIANTLPKNCRKIPRKIKKVVSYLQNDDDVDDGEMIL